MGNIISILQEIFMLKEDTGTKVGLSDFKGNNPYSETKKSSGREHTAKELKISDLMRRSSY